jgi:heme exporter protein B
VGETIRAALAIAAKDLRIELETRTGLSTAIAFALVVLVIFEFARDSAAVTRAAFAPSVLWVTLSYAGVIALNRAFFLEERNGALDGLLVAPVSRSAIGFGKFLGNLGFVLLVDLVVLPLFALFFDLTPSVAFAWVGLIVLLATIGFVAIGTLFAALAVKTRFAELLLPVLVLPFLVPPVLVGVETTSRLLGGRPIGEISGWVEFLALYDVVFLTVTILIFPAVVDE